jgi:hypothetical protein
MSSKESCVARALYEGNSCKKASALHTESVDPARLPGVQIVRRDDWGGQKCHDSEKIFRVRRNAQSGLRVDRKWTYLLKAPEWGGVRYGMKVHLRFT